jgi:hypothetical protein
MRTLTLTFLLSIFLFEGCIPVVKLSYGISRPKQESPESLLKFLQKKKYPAENQYQIKDSSTYTGLMKDTAFRSFLFTTVIFTGDFRRIEADTSLCQWSGGYLIEHLKTDSAYSVSDKFSFGMICSAIRPLFDSTDRFSVKPGDYDFIVVNTWARFIGRLNDRIFSAGEVVKERPDLKILVLNLNLDMQKSWNLNKDQRIKLD